MEPEKWFAMTEKELKPFLTLVSTPNPDKKQEKYDLIRLHENKIPIIYTTGGDATKIKKARQIILWTLIAVAIILFAKGFPALIKGALGG